MNLRSMNLSLAIGLCLVQVSAFSQGGANGQSATGKVEAIQKEVLRLEEAGRHKVLRGDANWDDLMAEGAYMIAFDGSVIIYKKGTNLGSFPVKSFNMSEMIVRVYGDETAVVTGLAEVAGESADKKPLSFQMRFLNVWRRSGDGWKIEVSERTGVKQAAK
jgi:hypothetical protein